MIAIVPEPIPLRVDADGVIRVGSTRVTLDTIVFAFREGLSAEEIVEQYSSLDLADVYAAISYFLKRGPEVESYLAERQAEAAKVREQNEARFDIQDLRQRLLARRL
jgi:uncharacterized protein (DUF433 family)